MPKPTKPVVYPVSISVPDVVFGSSTVASVSPDNGHLWVEYSVVGPSGGSYGSVQVFSGLATITIRTSPSYSGEPATAYANVLDYSQFDSNVGRPKIVGTTTFKVL